MTTTNSTWTSSTLHTTDAEFRTWGKEISDKFKAMTKIATAGDTGQINWATVTRAGTNADAGYEIFYLNDSLHATAPIYIKIYYGTYGSATYPRLRVEFGTSTNGSGTIGGIVGAVRTVHYGQPGSATTYPSYLSALEGFLGFVWKLGSAYGGSFCVCRSCDSDGTPNGKAAFLFFGNSGNATYAPVVQTLRFESTAAAQTADAQGIASCHPGSPSTSVLPNSNLQAYMAWMAAPDVRPVFGMASIIKGDFSNGATFTCALVGSTARTYITCVTGSVNSHFGPLTGSGNVSHGIAMLWE